MALGDLRYAHRPFPSSLPRPFCLALQGVPRQHKACQSEVRHANAYAHLLDLLGLEEAFREALAGSALRAREDALKSVLQASRGDLGSWTRALVLFSAFTEHVALFSAFYALLALNRRANLYKGTANAIEATSKEENIHGLFGLELVRILRREHPELFGERFSEDILREAERFLRAEEDLVAWIFEAGDPPCVSQAETRAFLRDRMNRVLALYGIPSGIAVDRASLRDVDWFDLELFATKEVDFFSKRSVAYSRRTRSFSPEELF